MWPKRCWWPRQAPWPRAPQGRRTWAQGFTVSFFAVRTYEVSGDGVGDRRAVRSRQRVRGDGEMDRRVPGGRVDAAHAGGHLDGARGIERGQVARGDSGGAADRGRRCDVTAGAGSGYGDVLGAREVDRACRGGPARGAASTVGHRDVAQLAGDRLWTAADADGA